MVIDVCFPEQVMILKCEAVIHFYIPRESNMVLCRPPSFRKYLYSLVDTRNKLGLINEI